MKAISIVSPNGKKIARGEKTIEVRSWKPNIAMGEDLLIVENQKFLHSDGETDPDGRPVAIVKIKNIRDYLESDIQAASASRWESGYYSWELEDVRPVDSNQTVLAARGIYEVEFSDPSKTRIPVEIYNSEWPRLFEGLKEKIWPVVREVALTIEHVGSTSVPGLAAKPVIDIDIVTESENLSQLAIQRLQQLGYLPLGDLGVSGREAFKRPADSIKHNLYVCLKSSAAYKNHILLRDYLRTNPEVRTQYAELKMQLAEEFAGNIDGYCKAKTSFIAKILEIQGVAEEELREVIGANT